VRKTTQRIKRERERERERKREQLNDANPPSGADHQSSETPRPPPLAKIKSHLTNFILGKEHALFSNAQKERIKKKKSATTKSEATSAATRVKKNFSFSFLFKREREREREREFTSGV